MAGIYHKMRKPDAKKSETKEYPTRILYCGICGVRCGHYIIDRGKHEEHECGRCGFKQNYRTG